MRSYFLLATSFLLFQLACVAPAAGAHSAFASRALAPSSSDPIVAAKPTKKVLVGTITNADGPLPGAVVILTATKQMAVTDAEGKFTFEVPVTTNSVKAVVTYAGYADERMTINTSAAESTISLNDTQVIMVSRQQQLKQYLKTAQ